ncbi:hypothetical protein B0H13DRAFT_1894198 [Mycena leptocephala]|nr:hypothetical protein B0H13DRAFT_1894198 [Mycena leptocephala]
MRWDGCGAKMGSLRRPRKKAKKRGRVTRTFGEIAGTLAFIARNFALPSVSFAGTLATGCQMGRELPAGDGGCDGRVGVGGIGGWRGGENRERTRHTPLIAASPASVVQSSACAPSSSDNPSESGFHSAVRRS